MTSIDVGMSLTSIDVMLQLTSIDVNIGLDMMKCLRCLKEVVADAHYGMHAECFCKWFSVEQPYEFSSLNRRTSSSNSDHSPVSKDSSFFHGKFKKYSAQLNDRSFILKMRQLEVPELPEVEYLCNQIGAFLNIPIANFFIIDFQEELVFVTENFMQKFKGADLQHIRHYRKDEEHNCRDLINLIKEKTNSPHQVNIFIDTVLFDALIGNHDRHGRNLAFIVQPNKIELSPIYDNVSYLALESGAMLKADFNPTGRISTAETYEPSMSEYAKDLKSLGYIEQLRSFYNRLDMFAVDKLIDSSFCGDAMKFAIKKLINKRYLELQNEI